MTDEMNALNIAHLGVCVDKLSEEISPIRHHLDIVD